MIRNYLSLEMWYNSFMAPPYIFYCLLVIAFASNFFFFFGGGGGGGGGGNEVMHGQYNSTVALFLGSSFPQHLLSHEKTRLGGWRQGYI